MTARLLAVAIVCLLPVAGACAQGDDGALGECWAQVKTRIALNDCLTPKLAAAEAAMAEAFDRARVQAHELDAVTDGRARVRERLDAAQAAFRAYRDARCDSLSARMEPGTGAGNALLGCRIDMTRNRTADLIDTFGSR